MNFDLIFNYYGYFCAENDDQTNKLEFDNL